MKNPRPWFTPVAPPGALRPVQLILATTAALWMGSISLPQPTTGTTTALSQRKA